MIPASALRNEGKKKKRNEKQESKQNLCKQKKRNNKDKSEKSIREQTLWWQKMVLWEDKLKKKWYSCVWLFVTPWAVAHQAPLSMGFSRQEYWSELPFPSPGESSPARDQTWISCIVGRFFINWATREALINF